MEERDCKLSLFSGSHTSCGEEGHRFEGRWDHAPQDCQKIDVTFWDQEKNILALTRKKYIHDICIYCGKLMTNSDSQEKEI